MSDKTKNIIWKFLEFLFAILAGAGGGAASGMLG